MATKSSISGAKELERVLRELDPRLAERELPSAARAGANVWRKALVAAAPRGAGPSAASKKFGPLHKNIKTVRLKKTNRSVEMAVHTGKAFWGSFLEFGTRNIAPRPWMSPVVESKVGAVLARTGRTLERRLQKTARELAGPLSKISKSTRRRI